MIDPYTAPSNIPNPPLAIGSKGRCERIVVTTPRRTYDLGRPDSLLFPLRVAFYKFRRRKELSNG